MANAMLKKKKVTGSIPKCWQVQDFDQNKMQ